MVFIIPVRITSGRLNVIGFLCIFTLLAVFFVGGTASLMSGLEKQGQTTGSHATAPAAGPRDDGGREIRTGILCLVLGFLLVGGMVAVVQVRARAEREDVLAQIGDSGGPLATYTIKHPKRGRLSGLSAEALREIGDADDLSPDTVIRNEQTGQMMPLSRLQALTPRE